VRYISKTIENVYLKKNFKFKTKNSHIKNILPADYILFISVKNDTLNKRLLITTADHHHRVNR